MYAEIKYDGERIQIHKDVRLLLGLCYFSFCIGRDELIRRQGNTFCCFSRNLKPVLPWKACLSLALLLFLSLSFL
jgi:hypothetical protein